MKFIQKNLSLFVVTFFISSILVANLSISFYNVLSNVSSTSNNIIYEENTDNSASKDLTDTPVNKYSNDIADKENISDFSSIETSADVSGVPILYYHSVDPSEKNEVIISPVKLKEQLTLIKDLGYTTLTISDFANYILKGEEIPKKSILITFDDGYMDNYTNAFPILKELNMKATIFLITSGIDDGYYLSTDQIKEMQDYGIDFESHTVNHKHLNTLTYNEQLNELKNSKEKLEKLLNKKIYSVAYPFGDYNNDTIKAAKEAGYSFAFTTNLGYAHKNDDLFKLNRIYVSSTYSIDTFKDRLLNTK
ncbi:MAG: polysaccharide deacetylase family protein [Clostridiales bacterium]|nr:polysaccharide deacetylase family protein [Clostridiales bacterium]